MLLMVPLPAICVLVVAERRAAVCNSFPKHLSHGLVQTRPFFNCERIHTTCRMNTSDEQRLICVDIANARDVFLL